MMRASDPAGGWNASELPAQWPTPWPHLYRPLRDRAVFVLMTMVLTTIGLFIAGDPAAQWWAIALPLLLLIGPATCPLRARAALRRAVENGRARTAAGRLIVGERGEAVWLQTSSGDPDLPLGAGPALPALHARAGSSAVVVWTRRRRAGGAVVLPDLAVVYLSRPPAGARDARVPFEVADEAGWSLPVRRISDR